MGAASLTAVAPMPLLRTVLLCLLPCLDHPKSFLGAFQRAHNELWHFYTAIRQVFTDGNSLVYRYVDANGQTDQDGKGNRKQPKAGKIVHEQVEAYSGRQGQKQ